MDLFRLLARCSLFIFVPALALADDSFLNNSKYSVNLDLGVAQPNNLGNSTSFPLGYSTFIYDSNRNKGNTTFAGFSLNKVFTINPLYTVQLGLSYHYTSQMNVSGNLEQGISQPYYQTTYSYSVNSSQYLVESKLQRQVRNRYFPYVYLGLGLASNNAYNYSTTAPDYLVVTPDYQNNRTNSFTYSAGLGLDYFVAKQISVGVGYRFSDLGKVGLGSGTIRNTQIGPVLKQSNLYTNTLLAQLTYYIA